MHPHSDNMSSIPSLTNDKVRSRASSPDSKKLNAKPEDHSLLFQTPDSTKGKNKLDGLKRSSTISSTHSSKSPARTHLRNLSITSTSSNVPNTQSSRKGINIGLSFVPIGSNGSLKEKDDNRTPRRQLFTGAQLTPSHSNSSAIHNQHQSMSFLENQDLSPVRNEDLGQRSSMETNNTDFSSIMGSSPTPQIPSIVTSGYPSDPNYDDLSDKFRLLASKEMEVLEIKNKVKELLKLQQDKEFELQQLKINIEKQLVSNLKQSNKVLKSPTSVQKRVLRPTNSSVDPLVDDSYLPISSDNILETSSPTKTDKRQSWFSKPLSFIHQLDSMVYKELGRLQLDDESGAPASDQSYSDNTLTGKAKQAKDDNKEINAPIKSLAFETNSAGTDVMQAVSQHLWTFVNDVRANLLVEEEDASTSEQQAHSSTKTSLNPTPQQNHNTRLRTASISKRQTYNQHNIHKKRPSMNIVKDSGSSKAESDQVSIGAELTEDKIADVVNSLSRNEVDVNDVKSTTPLKNHVLQPHLNGSLDGIIGDDDLWASEEQLDL